MDSAQKRLYYAMLQFLGGSSIMPNQKYAPTKASLAQMQPKMLGYMIKNGGVLSAMIRLHQGTVIEDYT